MAQSGLKVVFLLGLLLTVTASTHAQIATYYLHRENSTVVSSNMQLRTIGPDAATNTLQTQELKSQPPGEYAIKTFETQANVPNIAGVIPAGSSFIFRLYMDKTDTPGVIYPLAKLYKNSASGTSICNATGPFALNVVLAQHTFTCSSSTAVTFSATDRFFLWVGVNVATGAGSSRVKGELSFETNRDSRISVTLPTPQPNIANLSPATGSIGTPVTINGSNFGATQGLGTVTFNGVTATPNSWSNGSIVVPVPAGATTGPVVVSVNQVASNSVTFTTTSGSVTGTVTRAGDGVPITGALVEAVQGGLVKGSTNTLANGTYSIATLVPGTYDIRASADQYAMGLNAGVVVVAGSATTSNLILAQPGTILGRVTRDDGVTPIVGGIVKVYQGAATAAKVTTNISGDYTANSLPPGTYTVQASASGFNTSISPNATVTANNNTTVNFSLTTATNNNPIKYVYDDTGRLVAVIDPAGDTARYVYDAVGNLLSISRQSSALVSILEFTPKSGLAGTVVTIYGTGFSTTPSSNTVSFNGTAAVVSTATETQIVTTVPAGATTGLISVTTAAGSDSTDVPFVVAATGPVITGFTPNIGAAGTTVTVTGENFETTTHSNRAKFNGTIAAITAATATSISTSVPTGATSGHISVTTPLGTGVSTNDFFVPPSPYTAADVEMTARMAIGETKLVTVNTANKIALIIFDGVAGQRVSLQMTGVTISSSSVTVLNPNGTTFASAGSVGTGGGFIDTKTLGVTGTYTIMVDPQSTNTGSMTLNLFNIVNVTATITAGGTTPVTIVTPGQDAEVTFAGVSGQHVSLSVSGVTIPGTTTVTVKKPDGSTFASAGFGSSGGFLEIPYLTSAGTYTIFVDPSGADTGNIVLTLNDATDVTDTITPGGPAVVITTTIVGQNARLTFTGNAGQRVALNASTTFGVCWTLVIIKPDGTNLSSNFLCGSGVFLDPQQLPVSGTYTILIDPSGSATGQATVSLYDVTDVTGTITIDGPSVAATISTPGQIARLTFSGTAGVRLSINATSTFTSCWTLTVLKPDSTQLSSTFSCGSGIFVEPQQLPVSGTYTLVIDPSGASTGQATLNLYSVTDTTGTITIGGPSVMATISTPGQVARLTFSGTTSQRLSINTTSTFTSCWTLTVLKPDSTQLSSTFSCGSGIFVEPQQLPVNGTYTLVIDPSGASTGQATLNLYNVIDTTGTITVGGASVVSTISTPGQVGRLTFSGTTSQRLSINTTSTFTSCWTLTVLKPDSTQLSSTFSCGSGIFVEPQQLPVNGTYTLVIDPSGASTGQATLNLYNVIDTTGTITVGGASVVSTISTPGQIGRLTFSGTTSQRLSINTTSTFTGCWTLTVLKPDSTQLSSTFSCGSSIFVEPQQLPVNGTYTLVIDPSGASTGQATVNLYNVTDVSGTVTINGPALPVTTTVPGQNANITFSGTLGQQVTVRIANGTFNSCVTVTLLKPDATSLTSTFSCSGTFNLSQQTLPTTGTYTIKIDPSSAGIGSANVSVTNP